MTRHANAGGGGKSRARFGRRDRAVIAAAGICMLLVQMDFFALNLMLPVIGRDFHTPTTDLQWLFSGSMLALGSLLITAGRAADLWGRKRVLVIGLTGYAIASVGCAVAPNPAWLIAGRVVQGCTTALVFPVAVAVVTAYFQDARRARAVAIVITCGTIGTIVGPVVGGALAEHVSWRALFLLNLPFCLTAIVLLLRQVPETRDEEAGGRPDLPSVLTLAGGVAGLLIGVDQGKRWGWDSAATLGCIAAGLALLAVFLRIDQRSERPLLDLGLLRNRLFVAVALAGTLSNMVHALINLFSAIYLQQVRGLSPLGSGLVFLALSVGLGVGNYSSGHLAERIRPETLIVGGLLLSGVSLFTLTWMTDLAAYTAVFAVVGLGGGLVWALANVTTQSYVEPGRLAAASGLFLTTIVLFGAMTLAVGSTLLEAISGSAVHAASDGPAINTLLRGAALLSVLGSAALSLAIRGRRPVGGP
ncbi:MFS transporter [Streptomyces sp. WAC06614]|nr:MFS transporter [Streptomyces sp. WAC06614]